MSSVKVGGRVGAIQKGNDESVYLFGYGERLEDSVPPETVGGFNFGIPNPTLKMDDGTIVYGCESWWGPENKIKEMTEGKTIIIVKPDRVDNTEITGE